jgi:hypothetical protein
MQVLEHHALGALNTRLRDATETSARLLKQVTEAVCRRPSSVAQGTRSSRIERFVESGAWTDAALALVDLELPQWRVRRIAYDEGEWHCALSRQRELPDWLDQSVEARHEDLALAILGALVEAKCISAPSSRQSVPSVSSRADELAEILCSDNYA